MRRIIGFLLAAALAAGAQPGKRKIPATPGKPLLAAVTLAAATQGEKSRPARAALAAVETGFNARIRGFNTMDPMELFSSAQGVYLEGFGAVFTAQVDLIFTPTITPWRQKITKEDIQNVHGRKLARLAALKAQMREALAMAGVALEGMPANENVVLAVSLYQFTWEDRTGLPSQIVMQAPREKLLKRPVAEDAIQTQEF